ncbi:CRISPR-associated endonuclease Cas2 [Hazenella sp. IB182353]|uniref:CRISPR-associated endonuclease Cas2 n=1 Tax=Polycladospora coralii TaxID=2771432 RepID=UPI001746235A|nr:CRISPR-associated endonuclease Cas2 [Polycladospora coralii]MBS7530268.1 CRISPR-associated endonuclease Cas2 [Polycladospora coralii]
MANKLNCNYAFVFYDINEKRVQKIFKICKKYLVHYQNSVFRGTITSSKILKLKKEIETVINPEEDFVSIITMMNEHTFSEIALGTSQKTDGEALLL